MDKYLCIWHANCIDGYGAYWAVCKALVRENVESHPAIYNITPIPDVTDRNVIIVDFSYSLKDMTHIVEKANSVIILDHHESAMKTLWELHSRGLAKGNYSNDSSGAVMAWGWFNPDKPVPQMLLHIQDNDWWKFKLPGTKEIIAYITSYDYDLDQWDQIAELLEMRETQFDSICRIGASLLRKSLKDMNEIIELNKRFMNIGSIHAVPVVNAPHTMKSDVGNMLAHMHGCLIGATYYDTADARVFSLRSTEDGPDVSAIARKYKGGGHYHAASFRAPRGWEGE